MKLRQLIFPNGEQLLFLGKEPTKEEIREYIKETVDEEERPKELEMLFRYVDQGDYIMTIIGVKYLKESVL